MTKSGYARHYTINKIIIITAYRPLSITIPPEFEPCLIRYGGVAHMLSVPLCTLHNDNAPLISVVVMHMSEAMRLTAMSRLADSQWGWWKRKYSLFFPITIISIACSEQERRISFFENMYLSAQFVQMQQIHVATHRTPVSVVNDVDRVDALNSNDVAVESKIWKFYYF